MTTTPFSNKFEWVRAISDPNSGLTSTQHHVALALSQYLNVDGKGFVTQARLATDIRMCERAVCAALSALTKMNWITRKRGRPGYATSYTITRPADWEPTPTDEQAKSQSDKRRYENEELTERTERFLAQIATATGISPAVFQTSSDTNDNLRNVIRRHINSVAGDDDSLRILFQQLTETPLSDADDTAKVLLYRYGQALRRYPHLSPKAFREPRNSKAFEDALALTTAALSIKNRLPDATNQEDNTHL